MMSTLHLKLIHPFYYTLVAQTLNYSLLMRYSTSSSQKHGRLKNTTSSPFAKTAEGNTYAFYKNVEVEGEYPIVLIWEDDEAEYVAKNFEDFIFRKMLEAADDIDKDDLYADYGKDEPMELYRTDLKTDLKAIRPYLKDEYISVLEEAYNGEVLETLIAYGFKSTKPVKEVMKEMLDFELMGEVFDHEG